MSIPDVDVSDIVGPGMMSAIELIDIHKSFDGRPALSGARFQVNWGEVHALLGENGAGKSTLMSVVCGIYAPDRGALSIGGAPVNKMSPSHAINLGIGVVHQHFKLVRNFTVAENVFLYCGEKLGYGSAAAMSALLSSEAEKLGLAVKPDALVGDISVAERQRVEILKVLLGGARLLIFDEPTAVLTDDESEAVLGLLKRMAADGCAIVLITHKLREVLEFSDRVTVMRHGTTVADGIQTRGLTLVELSHAMVGEDTARQEREQWPLGPARLSVSNLSAGNSTEGRGIAGVSFEIRRGEIFGIAGVGGNGQAELVDALIGLSGGVSGTIALDDRAITNVSTSMRRQAGVRYIPADRFKSGITANMPVYENFGSTRVMSGDYGPWWYVRRAKMRSDAEKAIMKQKILGCGARTVSRLLSGGNAQKLLLAREIGREAALIVAHSPTRGLDVQACQTVHLSLLDATRQGAACLLVSEDLDEVLALSNSVAVMNRGRIAGILSGNEISREKIGELMLGHA